MYSPKIPIWWYFDRFLGIFIICYGGLYEYYSQPKIPLGWNHWVLKPQAQLPVTIVTTYHGIDEFTTLRANWSEQSIVTKWHKATADKTIT